MSTVSLDLTGSDVRDDIDTMLDAYKALSLMASEARPANAKDVSDVLYVLNAMMAAVLTPITESRTLFAERQDRQMC